MSNGVPLGFGNTLWKTSDRLRDAMASGAYELIEFGSIQNGPTSMELGREKLKPIAGALLSIIRRNASVEFRT